MMTVRDMALNHLHSNGWYGIGFPGNRPTASGAIRPGVNQPAPQTNAAIRTAGQNLTNLLDALSGAEGYLRANTGDANIATVLMDRDNMNANMPPRDTTIYVAQVAQAQANVSDAVESRGLINEGTYTFQIAVGDQLHDFEIEVSAGDDALTVQRRMADAINDADIGITASVQTGTRDGVAISAMTIAANETGTEAQFAIRDTGSGDLISSMNLDGMTAASRAGQDAMFRIDGGELITQQSNEIELAAGVTATFTGRGETRITFDNSPQETINAARDLVNAINSAIRGTDPNDGRGSERFLNDLIGANINFAPLLARAGIEVQENGQLAINETQLRDAIESGTFERTIGSFTSRIERIANNATNTRHYANAPQPVQMNLNNFDFGNTSSKWAMMNLFM